MTFRRVGACSLNQAIELAEYLAHTHVPYHAQLLRARAAGASVVELVDRDTLGETWTIFGELGGVHAPTTVRRAKFVVREVRGILARPECTDGRSRDRLAELLAAEASGTLVDRRITLALTDAGTLIVDGNKRAAAIYELAGGDIVLPAFLIESAPGYPPLRMP